RDLCNFAGKICCWHSRCCRATTYSLISFLLLAAIGLVTLDLLFDDLERREFAKVLEITNGSMTYRLLTGDSDGLFNITVMSVINPYEVQYKMAKPRLKTHGPFIYRKIVKKKNISFSMEDGRQYIQFMYYSSYHFNLNLSSDDANKAVITVPNLANSVIRYIIDGGQGKLGSVAKRILRSNMFINITVNDFLWGYEDSDLWWLSWFKYSDSGKTGVLIALNNSISGPYKLNTGTNDISRLGILESFENKTYVQHYFHRLHASCLRMSM
uniref:Beta-lactamase domain-containing protein n=1 Tax=Mesocestoides corti TaxID=53468 RepID=A0A5K3F0L0_MESCO